MKKQPLPGRAVVWNNSEDHSEQEDIKRPVRNAKQLFRKLAVLIVLSLLVGFGSSWGVRAVSSRQEEARIKNLELAQNAERAALAETDQKSAVGEAPRVLAETDVNSPGLLASENFRIGQIIIGGDVGVLLQGDEFSELGISDVRGETLGSKDKNEGRALITWKTTKPALSTVKYGRNAGGSESVFTEDGYGLTHSAVLDQLDLASTYLYTISVRDRYGKELTSDSYAIYTGSKVVSLFELIVNALQDVFGWAVKK